MVNDRTLLYCLYASITKIQALELGSSLIVLPVLFTHTDHIQEGMKYQTLFQRHSRTKYIFSNIKAHRTSDVMAIGVSSEAMTPPLNHNFLRSQ